MGSKVRLTTVLLSALALTVLAAPGCSLLDYLKTAPKPEISFSNAKLNNLSWQKADMVLNFKLKNPYPVAIGVAGYEWDMKVSSKPFLSGQHKKGVNVGANKASTIPLPFTLKFADLISRIADAKEKAEVPYEVKGKISINSPIGPISLPLKASGKLPVLEKPTVRLKTITAKLQGMTKLVVNIGLGLQHKNEYKITLADLGYNLKLEGYKVASGKTTPSKSVPGSGESVVNLPIEVDLIQASSALMSSIMSGKFKYELGTDLGLTTPFGRAPFAFDEAGTLKLY